MNLITWNIQSCRGCDGRVDPKRIVDVCRGMADFDVLCFQEVARNYPDLPGSSGEDQFALLGGLLPGFIAAEGIAVDVLDAAGKRRQFGNPILCALSGDPDIPASAALAGRCRRCRACSASRSRW